MKKINLTGWILIAMAAGALTGLIIHLKAPREYVVNFSSYVSVITDIFLRLIKMIIAPLVFSTLVTGIAKLGDIRALGRIGGKTLLWFVFASLLSLLLGLVVMNLTRLGQHLNLPMPEANAKSGIEQSAMSFGNFVSHVFPKSIIEAMANNEILQIVVFSIFFGVGTAAIGEKGLGIIRALDALAQVILKVTGYVMNLAPLAAYAAIASILALRGPALLQGYLSFLVVFYISILALWALLMLLGSLFLGRSIFSLIIAIKEVIFLAFGTASSEAAFPKLVIVLEEFGCPAKIVSFVLPLGYSFNLDGSMLYMTFASLFIAQAYGIHMPLQEQVSMLLALMLTSKGIAGVPRAALVVVAGTISMYNIPQQGLLLLLGIDQIMDMARSATNVVGNSIATAVISRLENTIKPGNRAFS